MMRLVLLLSPLLIGTVGCGTLANLDGKRVALLDASGQVEPRIYGGVRNDVRWGGPFWLDLPLSAAADTLTIPMVIRKRRNPELWQKEPYHLKESTVDRAASNAEGNAS